MVVFSQQISGLTMIYVISPKNKVILALSVSYHSKSKEFQISQLSDRHQYNIFFCFCEGSAYEELSD
jgi:hypothetical protein